MMNVLFVHEVDYLKKVVFEMHEFPEHLSTRGHNVVFIDFPENASASLFKFQLKDQVIRGRALPDSELRLLRLPRLLPSPFDRLLLALLFPLYLLQAIQRVRPQVVVLYGVPTNGWQTVLLCKLFRIPVVYRAIDVSHLIRDTKFKWLVRQAEKCVVRNARLVLANSAAMVEHVNNLGADATRVKALFPGFVKSNFASEPQETESPVVLFMGTLFDFCGLEELICWISEYGTHSKKSELWVMGDGPSRVRIEETAHKVGLEHKVRMMGVVPFNDLYHRMREATVAVLPFQETYVTNVALPGKVPQYIWAGLPVVSTHLKGLKSLLEEGTGVCYASPGREFVDVVDRLLVSPGERRALVEAGQKELSWKCDWSKVTHEFETILLNL